MFSSTGKSRSSIVCAVLVFITVIIYWPVFKAQFTVYDDDIYVTENAHVNTGLSVANIGWAFESGEASNWHPLTWISHMLDVQLYRLQPLGHHLTNLLFHLANTLLLFFWLRQFTGAFWRSALVAALFAWHPLHVESVAWVAERKDVLSTFFWLLTLISYRKFQIRSAHHRGYYAAALVFFALGLMAKPMVVTLPCVLLLLDYWDFKRREISGASAKIPWSKLLQEKAPFFALVVISCLVTYFVQQQGGAMHAADKLRFSQKFSNALTSYVAYLGGAFWPHDLAVLYPFQAPPPSWKLFTCEFLLIAVTVFGQRQLERKPYFLIGWLWYLGTLVPVIGFVQVGSQSRADRYTYIPLIGIFILIAWGLNDLVTRWPKLKTLTISTASLFLGFCAWSTSVQAAYWKNSETLFKHTLAVTKNNFIIYCDLGAYYVMQGRSADAITAYEEGLKIEPFSDLELNLSDAFAEQNRIDEALEHARKALELNPGNVKGHHHLGQLMYRQGKIGAAIEQCREALQLQPYYVPGIMSLAKMLAEQNDFPAAIEQMTLAAKLDPNGSSVHNQFAGLLMQANRPEEAVTQYRETIRIHRAELAFDPNSIVSLNNLAWLLATCPASSIRNGPEAVTHARRACELAKWRQPVLIGTVAAALAESGQFDEAVKMAQNARQLALTNHEAKVAARNEELAKIYQSRQAYHESPADTSAK